MKSAGAKDSRRALMSIRERSRASEGHGGVHLEEAKEHAQKKNEEGDREEEDDDRKSGEEGRDCPLEI